MGIIQDQYNGRSALLAEVSILSIMYQTNIFRINQQMAVFYTHQSIAIRRFIPGGTPLGDPSWTERTAAKLNLESTLRPRDPKKVPDTFNSRQRINKIWGINISFMIGGSWMAVVMRVFICFGLFSSLAEGGRIDFYHPSIIVSQPELDWIRQKVQAGEEPWKSAYDEMIKYAEEWMGRTPDPPDEINIPAYYDDPEANGKASKQLGEAGRITNLFALAYQMTDKTAYAEKALSFLMAWANKMVKGDKGYDTSLRICNHVTQMVIAADLLWHYPGFSREEKRQFQKWIRENMTAGVYEEFSYDYTNHGHWGMWAAMTIETILEREDKFLKAVERFKSLVRNRIQKDGLIMEKWKTRPERSLLYMIYAIEPTVRAAELARHYDIDLYNYKASNGRSLKLAVDNAARYALHPGDWPYKADEQYTWWGLPRSFWEMAYREWRDPDYLEILKHDNGRPGFWRWTGKREFLACPTLTHGVPYGYSGYLPTVRDDVRIKGVRH